MDEDLLNAEADEFEREMQLEFDQRAEETMTQERSTKFHSDMELSSDDERGKKKQTKKKLQQKQEEGGQGGGSSVGEEATSCKRAVREQTTGTEDKYYDKVYFDSDEDDEWEDEDGIDASTHRRDISERRKVIRDEDLFYDPHLDELDERQISNTRRKYLQRGNILGGKKHLGAAAKGKKGQKEDGRKNKLKPLPNSDAVLNCPACFTLLCLDCQRHEIYRTQYRAMFVFNCNVDVSEQLSCPLQAEKNKSKRKRKGDRPRDAATARTDADSVTETCRTDGDQESSTGGATAMVAMAGDELFNPVKCAICTTTVAVRDKDEVFHFFNVIAGS